MFFLSVLWGCAQVVQQQQFDLKDELTGFHQIVNGFIVKNFFNYDSALCTRSGPEAEDYMK